MKFKIGDRVQCISPMEEWHKVVNELGTVIQVDEKSGICAVVFDNFIDGHSFKEDNVRPVENANCLYGHGLWCYESILQHAFVCEHKAGDLLNILQCEVAIDD